MKCFKNFYILIQHLRNILKPLDIKDLAASLQWKAKQIKYSNHGHSKNN